MSQGAALCIEGLTLDFQTFDGPYRALEGVDLAVEAGEIVGVVGETGCGKSVLAKTILRLLDEPPARYPAGRVLWGGEDLLQAAESRLRRVRGTEIAMVFQDPATFLDPLYTAGDHVAEALRHRAQVLGERLDAAARRAAAVDLLASLGLPEPRRVAASYPHQLSGGMRQRVLIAGAMAGRPRLLVADEPTTALDVTVQAQILRLIARLVEETGVSVLLISHDLGVIASLCRRIVVMYAGTVVEDAPKAELLARPRHPYTVGLIAAVPRLGSAHRTLAAIPGQIPNLLDPPPGCRFAERCARATACCRLEAPSLRDLGGHRVACHHAEA